MARWRSGQTEFLQTGIPTGQEGGDWDNGWRGESYNLSPRWYGLSRGPSRCRTCFVTSQGLAMQLGDQGASGRSWFSIASPQKCTLHPWAGAFGCAGLPRPGLVCFSADRWLAGEALPGTAPMEAAEQPRCQRCTCIEHALHTVPAGDTAGFACSFGQSPRLPLT